MYKINRYLYISKGTHSKHEIFARNEAFADELAKRIMPLAEIDAISSEIDNQIKIQKQKLESSLIVNEEDVTKYAISASKDNLFLMALL